MLTIKLDKRRDGVYWLYRWNVAGEFGGFAINTREEQEQSLNNEIKKIISNLKYTLEITTSDFATITDIANDYNISPPTVRRRLKNNWFINGGK